MAVTVLERPEGHVLSSTANTALTSSVYGTTDALFGKTAHGLMDGDYIYVTSDIEDYNGFWYVDVISANTFRLQQYSGSDYVQYIQNATITYYSSIYSHGWSAAHLPITYRLSSDLYPTNTVDTVRNVTSQVNTDGYTSINLSGSLGVIHSYDYIYLTTPNDDLTGVYQIIEWVSNTSIIINLAYSSSNVLTSATAQKYYNNYNILVRVYVGIHPGHDWEAKKPYELAATLELTPDENGEVFFSVNELAKSYLETRNNPILGTLPNNTDFWNNFYIEYSESYDDSDGYALGTYTAPFISDSDNFEGYGVNADLEFKNTHSGFMSEYIMRDGSGKFLTNFSRPTLFNIVYQDISFIKESNKDYTVYKQYYLNGQLGILESVVVSGDEGVYRLPLVANCAYDRVDIWIDADLSPVIQPGTGSLIVDGYEPVVTIGPA